MAGPMLFVTVGTIEHPFTRLVGWADAWAAAHPEASVLVQYGTAEPPRHAAGKPWLPHAEHVATMTAADVVVTQGGPGGITDCRKAGKLPIVVARDSRLGETVDDHQLRFTAHVHRYDRIALAHTRAEFDELVARALAAPHEFRVDAGTPPTAATASTVEAALLDLVVTQRWPWSRGGRAAPSPARTPGRAPG